MKEITAYEDERTNKIFRTSRAALESEFNAMLREALNSCGSSPAFAPQANEVIANWLGSNLSSKVYLTFLPKFLAAMKFAEEHLS